jgi:hypothetical protein
MFGKKETHKTTVNVENNNKHANCDASSGKRFSCASLVKHYAVKTYGGVEV